MSASHLQRCTPETQGISSSALLAFIDKAEQEIHHLHSIMLLRHGNVVAEGWWHPYAAQHPHMLFSLSKSFTSTGIGLVIAEGLLSLDDSLLSFFPDDAPETVSDNLAAMNVRHLLTMTSGHKEDTMGPLSAAKNGNWTKTFLGLPVDYSPGTHFLYNTGASYMLSAIVQKVTGMTLLAYLQPRLFEPLGIEDASWEVSPQGINVGGFGLSIKTEDIARFGHMLLQKGRWNGQQIVPADWVEQATSFQVSNAPSENPDWAQGYGFQFWRCRHAAYRGDGAFGQYCLVLPEQDAVVAITSGLGNMQQVLDLIWEGLLPALTPQSLPEDAVALTKLKTKLDSLALPAQSGESVQPESASISGKSYAINPNPAGIEMVRFTFSSDEFRFFHKDSASEEEVVCAIGGWRQGTTTIINHVAMKISANGAWTAAGEFTMDLWFYETPFCLKITSKFDDDQVQIEMTTNVKVGDLEFPLLVGKSV